MEKESRPIDYDEIPFEKEGILYRGISQSQIEKLILRNILQRRENGYFGNALEENQILTFVTPGMLIASIYSIRNLKESIEFGLDSEDFTTYPMILGIKARNYKNRIFLPRQGDGIFIKGAINFEDVLPIYGFNINNIGTSKNEKEGEEFIIEKINDLLKEGYAFPKSSLVENYLSGRVNKSKLCGLSEKLLLSLSGDEFQEYPELDMAIEELKQFLNKKHFSNQNS
jgi:hypothetical protein